MKYSITKESTSLVITLDTESGKYTPQITVFNDPNVVLENNSICFLENGMSLMFLQFNEIGLIDGVAPTDLSDAVIKILVVVNSIRTLATPKFKGSIVPTDTPSGTEDAYWIATQAGTYTNFGNFVLPANTRAEVSRVSGVFSNSQTALTLTEYAKIVDVAKRDVGITIIDNQSNPIDYGFKFENQYLGNINNIRVTWTSTILVASLYDTDKYAFLIATSGLRSIILTAANTTAYIKHSDISLYNTGVLPIYYTRWNTTLVKDPNNIILITKNKSGYFKDCSGPLADFIKSQLNSASLDSISSRVLSLEGMSSSTLSAYDRGLSKKEYSIVKKFGILTAGQSNTQGRVPLSTQPPSWYNPATPTIPLTKIWNNSSKIWQNFTVPSLWAYDSEVYYRLSNYLAADIYVIKHALGGTAISEKASTTQPCWQPFFEKPSVSVTKLTKQFEQYIREMMLSAEFSNIQIKAFLWHQGESDSVAASVNSQSSTDYYNNFKNLIAYVRGVVGNPILPIVFGTISHTSAQYDVVIEAAQIQIKNEDVNVYMVDMRSGTLLDLYHFDGVSSESLGNQMFNIIKDF